MVKWIQDQFLEEGGGGIFRGGHFFMRNGQVFGGGESRRGGRRKEEKKDIPEHFQFQKRDLVFYIPLYRVGEGREFLKILA